MDQRRALLRFLAASPLLAASGAASRLLAAEPASAAQALDVFDLERVAAGLVPPAHWGYLQSGVDGDATLRANQAAWSRWQLVPRRFTDVSRVDLSTTLFGSRVASPVILSPIGSLRALHLEADRAVARAARERNHQQVVSTQMSDPIEDVAAERGAPLWFQLYTTNRPEAMRALVRRAERAGCTVVAVTVDLPAGRNTVTAARLRAQDTRQCGQCHVTDERGSPRFNLAAKAMFAGIDTAGLGLTDPALTWDFVRRLKDLTTMKVVIKGIESAADAARAVEAGADGVMVSNHGGRALETGRGTAESLPDVVQAVAGRIPVLVDGGVRRGTDVYKALALGASGVGIGRPYAWGLAAYGAAGVARALDILNLELRLAMVGCGARSVGEIGRASLVEARPGVDAR